MFERREVMKKNYQIYLSTPLGIKKGTMSFLELKGKINGYLNVMNNKNKFSGFLLADGQINLEGLMLCIIGHVEQSVVAIFF